MAARGNFKGDKDSEIRIGSFFDRPITVRTRAGSDGRDDGVPMLAK